MTSQPVRWEAPELIEILGFINNHFDAWHKNRLDACNMAIKATNNSRDAKSIYNKVHSLIKPVEEFLKTGKKSTTCTIVWENRAIHGLLREIIKQKKKYEENSSRASDSDVEMIIYDDDDEVTTEATTETSRPFSTEMVDIIYNEKIQQIDQSRYKLIETIGQTNDTFKKYNFPSHYSIETIDSSCAEKSKQIFKLRSELITMIETANNMYEKMKNFQ
ncbi:hypothetical protein C1645_738600 [Glomus cerebriforme]|uniref:Uncharacterized protein n=1 Tax=Glomus cerebriforme TaxID=658196 RepID=A0A397T0E7_9GLOM|nr:hypothetical protein C1645_790550 [Glomus cerebriforme]RIA89527.1 hypothetical protein C1645_738600 [Glomus cerebriforme]